MHRNKFSTGRPTMRSIIKPITHRNLSTWQVSSWIKITASCYFHSPTRRPAPAPHPSPAPLTPPRVTAAVRPGQSPGHSPSCLSLPSSAATPTSSANTWDRETGQLQPHQERGDSFAQSWGDASWNLRLASRETFSTGIKDGNSCGDVICREGGCAARVRARSSLRINKQPNSWKVEYAKGKATGIKFSYRNWGFEWFEYHGEARSLC